MYLGMFVHGNTVWSFLLGIFPWDKLHISTPQENKLFLVYLDVWDKSYWTSSMIDEHKKLDSFNKSNVKENGVGTSAVMNEYKNTITYYHAIVKKLDFLLLSTKKLRQPFYLSKI